MCSRYLAALAVIIKLTPQNLYEVGKNPSGLVTCKHAARDSKRTIRLTFKAECRKQTFRTSQIKLKHTVEHNTSRASGGI